LPIDDLSQLVCDDGPPKSFVLRAGMIAVVPQGAWHRFRSAEGGTTWSATLPGDHIELDVDDPRTVEPRKVIASGTPSIVDLDTELAKLTMFRGRTPQSTMAERKGSAARLASYRDGGLSITKFAGKGHWEAHLAGDELIHVLDGAATLEILGEDGPQSFALRAGMIAVNPQGAWHRFQSSEGVTLMAATPFPSEVIELDVDAGSLPPAILRARRDPTGEFTILTRHGRERVREVYYRLIGRELRLSKTPSQTSSNPHSISRSLSRSKTGTHLPETLGCAAAIPRGTATVSALLCDQNLASKAAPLNRSTRNGLAKGDRFGAGRAVPNAKMGDREGSV
jgi:mannose-6-phosphate isomerase-like protein (cupin superfamily)